MTEYRISGDVTFDVSTEWDSNGPMPTRTEAIEALETAVQSSSSYEFEDVTVSVTTSATYQPSSQDSSETVTDNLRDDAKQLANERVTIHGTTTVRVTSDLHWEGEPSTQRVRDVLAEETPSSAVYIQYIDNISVNGLTT